MVCSEERSIYIEGMILLPYNITTVINERTLQNSQREQSFATKQERMNKM